jgi:hypothetical protein
MYEDIRGPMWPTIQRGLRQCPGERLLLVKRLRVGRTDSAFLAVDCAPFQTEEDLHHFFAEHPVFSLPFEILVLAVKVERDAMMRWLGEGNPPEDHPAVVAQLALEAPPAVGEA